MLCKRANTVSNYTSKTNKQTVVARGRDGVRCNLKKAVKRYKLPAVSNRGIRYSVRTTNTVECYM